MSTIKSHIPQQQEDKPILITGNPGVGKHTICKILSTRTGNPILDVNETAKEQRLLEPDKKNQTNNVDIHKLQRIICKQETKGKIITGHLAPYVISKKQISMCIILRRDPYDLLQVYKERGYSEQKSRENAGAEILGVIAHDTLTKFQGVITIQIDTSNTEPQQIVDRILAIIHHNNHKAPKNSDRITKSDHVDWLSTIPESRKLAEFFPD